jgi:hypothetical protein
MKSDGTYFNFGPLKIKFYLYDNLNESVEIIGLTRPVWENPKNLDKRYVRVRYSYSGVTRSFYTEPLSDFHAQVTASNAP